MEAREIIGHSQDELSAALDLMESSIETGHKARVTICTEALPTDIELEDLFLGMLMAGCEVTRPTARLINRIPTTKFVIRKGSPQWQVIIPVLIPILTIGLIAFGIAKIEAISRALVPLVLITVGGLIILAVAVQKPALRYIERLPETKKVLAAR